MWRCYLHLWRYFSASHTYLREDKKKGELTQAELIILNFRLDLIPLNLTFIFHSVADSFSGCYCESCVPTLAKAVKYQSCCKILSSARKYFFSPEVGIGICFGATGNVLLSWYFPIIDCFLVLWSTFKTAMTWPAKSQRKRQSEKCNLFLFLLVCKIFKGRSFYLMCKYANADLETIPRGFNILRLLKNAVMMMTWCVWLWRFLWRQKQF